jgi:hypothetical protein
LPVPGFAQHQAKAALLGVDAQDVEHLLLVIQEREVLGVERMTLEAKIGTNHKW